MNQVDVHVLWNLHDKMQPQAFFKSQKDLMKQLETTQRLEESKINHFFLKKLKHSTFTTLNCQKIVDSHKLRCPLPSRWQNLESIVKLKRIPGTITGIPWSGHQCSQNRRLYWSYEKGYRRRWRQLLDFYIVVSEAIRRLVKLPGDQAVIITFTVCMTREQTYYCALRPPSTDIDNTLQV